MRSQIARRRNARAPGLGPLPWRRIHGFSAQKHGAAVHAISGGEAGGPQRRPRKRAGLRARIVWRPQCHHLHGPQPS